MSKFSRRDFLTSSALGFGALSSAASLTGCNSSADPLVSVSFQHGVASGDPLKDRLIIWTRVSPERTNVSLEVTWQLSETNSFRIISKTGKVTTDSGADFTVKVDVSGLDANKTYYYRFICNGTTSPVGRAKTLPVGAVSQVKLAVCSCANYPAGYFHVYAEMAKHNDLDAFLHLGDYTYEYGMGGYATEDAVALGRALPADNNTETIKLNDYRKRYALYRTDTSLQTLHANTAMIAVWDDHELSNDAWINGAENHDTATEGDFNARKVAALQAYFEWMPIRPANATDRLTIYRQFNFGNLVNLMMLDTRIIARSQQLEYKNYINPTTGAFDAVKFQTDLLNPARTVLGANQLAWLQNAIATSNATWNVLGQQILMSKMLIPAELLPQLDARDLAVINQTVTELLTIKGRIAAGDPTVTEQEKARLYTVVPYNLDAWDGYAVERENVYGAALRFNKKLVVLAGDTHNAWYSKLHNQAIGEVPQMQVGVEFATSSVGSPGLEEYLSLPAAQVPAVENVFTSLINELEYANLNERGYLLVTFNQTTVSADWRFVNTIKNKVYQVDTARSHNVTLNTSLQSAGDIATAV